MQSAVQLLRCHVAGAAIGSAVSTGTRNNHNNAFAAKVRDRLKAAGGTSRPGEKVEQLRHGPKTSVASRLSPAMGVSCVAPWIATGLTAATAVVEVNKTISPANK